MSFWTDANVVRAAALSRQGMSYGQIATHLGVSRNAVAGLARRKRDLFPKIAHEPVAAAKSAAPAKPAPRTKAKAERFAWTDELRQRAAALWADGKSYRAIGETLGCDRTTVGVLAKQRRDLLPKREKSEPAAASKKPAKATARMAHFGLPFRHTTFRGTERDLSEHAIEGVEPKTFAALTARECRFPLVAFDAAGGPDMPCCGAETMLGQSWCAHHFRIVFPGRAAP
ncbi:GcrA family cell cycle regulator [Martelella sp. HB161492]|uniref:GcrA family cell cycle regulator n=1 Tax=Martelella sp. HB161492 TaxID=2720726 RepID=UPI001591EE39|nr:GcrA family cell cycle regulator [Martelella sp. HB161492]